jgi:4-amino-4-deoxy-L-arabinose transferase-like glycosyltransferase
MLSQGAARGGPGGSRLIGERADRQPSRWNAAALAAIVVAALLVRLPALTASSASYRLTAAFNPEEAENLRISTGMLHKHTLNPHAFEYPSLFYYASLLPERLASRAGATSWPLALEGVRALSLLFSIGAVLAAAALARRVAGAAAGLFAATLMAFDRTQIEIATLAKPNAAQVFFVLAAFLALASLATRPSLAAAVRAAALLALATATKWLGALGLAGLLVAPLLAHPSVASPGWRRLADSARASLAKRIPAWQPFLPLLVFGAVFVACVPFALLSPREFGIGFAQTFTAQSVHQRPLPFWMPLAFLARSLGPAGTLAAAIALLWAMARMAAWDGSAHDRALALVLGWASLYGLMLMFVFVKLPSYVDLWSPLLAVLAGCAWAGERGLLRAARGRAIATLLAAIAGLVANGGSAAARSRIATEFDTRVAAAEWLDQAAADSDAVLSDLGAFVPDRIRAVSWNGWGGPPRVVYDETLTWGSDPQWPEWDGGHRRVLFVNAKWRPALERLAERPRWVVVNDEWKEIRAHPAYASESAAPDFDRRLVGGAAGYAMRARFEPSVAPGNDWRVLGIEKRTQGGGPWYGGPALTIYERARK